MNINRFEERKAGKGFNLSAADTNFRYCNYQNYCLINKYFHANNGRFWQSVQGTHVCFNALFVSANFTYL